MVAELSGWLERQGKDKKLGLTRDEGESEQLLHCLLVSFHDGCENLRVGFD